MLTKLTLGAVALAAAALMTPASAAPLSPLAQADVSKVADSGLVEQARWYHRHHRWNRYYYGDDWHYRRHHHWYRHYRYHHRYW